jgi:hypothetical protein
MPSPQVLPPAPPEFHPEFGYLWPAAHNRRTLRTALMATAFGVLLGLFAASVMASRAPDEGAQTATALSAVPAEPARAEAVSAPTAVAPTVAAPAPAVSTKSCSEQTWPYIDTKCLNETKMRSKREPVRILKPEAAVRSAAQMPEAEVTASAKAEESPRTSKKSAKRRQRQHDRETVYTDRGRYDRSVDPRSAYATPYRPPYEMRRGWDW